MVPKTGVPASADATAQAVSTVAKTARVEASVSETAAIQAKAAGVKSSVAETASVEAEAVATNAKTASTEATAADTASFSLSLGLSLELSELLDVVLGFHTLDSEEESKSNN